MLHPLLEALLAPGGAQARPLAVRTPAWQQPGFQAVPIHWQAVIGYTIAGSLIEVPVFWTPQVVAGGWTRTSNTISEADIGNVVAEPFPEDFVGRITCSIEARLRTDDAFIVQRGVRVSWLVNGGPVPGFSSVAPGGGQAQPPGAAATRDLPKSFATMACECPSPVLVLPGQTSVFEIEDDNTTPGAELDVMLTVRGWRWRSPGQHYGTVNVQ